MATALGAKLKLARERLGLSRSEVARRSDIDPAMLFRIENSDNAAPTFAAVSRIARVLGASLEWLALDDESGDGRPSAKPTVLDFEARRSLVVAAQHLEFAIASLGQASDESPNEMPIRPKTAKPIDVRTRPRVKKKNT